MVSGAGYHKGVSWFHDFWCWVSQERGLVMMSWFQGLDKTRKGSHYDGFWGWVSQKRGLIMMVSEAGYHKKGVLLWWFLRLGITRKGVLWFHGFGSWVSQKRGLLMMVSGAGYHHSVFMIWWFLGLGITKRVFVMISWFMVSGAGYCKKSHFGGFRGWVS